MIIVCDLLEAVYFELTVVCSAYNLKEIIIIKMNFI